MGSILSRKKPSDKPGTVHIVPPKHTIVARQPDGTSVPTPLVVSIDVSEIEFS
jgi:hypothetical protein